MRVVILGDAGCCKTTLAGRLAADGKAERLDPDSVVWEPGQVAVQRDPATALAEVECFCRPHHR
jgi:adenylate kinase family enzyme